MPRFAYSDFCVPPAESLSRHEARWGKWDCGKKKQNEDQVSILQSAIFNLQFFLPARDRREVAQEDLFFFLDHDDAGRDQVDQSRAITRPADVAEQSA